MDNGQLTMDNEEPEPSAFQQWCQANATNIPIAIDLNRPGIMSFDLRAYGEAIWAGATAAAAKSVPPAVAGGQDTVSASYALGVLCQDLRIDHTRISQGEQFGQIRQWIARLNAAEMEHKMAAAEWAMRETDLKDVIKAGEDACRKIAEQRDGEERLARAMTAARDSVVDRCSVLEQALAATGVYLAGLQIYDVDPTARRIVERNLELLRSSIDNGQLTMDNEEKAAPVAGPECQRLGHDFVVDNYQMVCRRCPNPGAPTNEGVQRGTGEGVSMRRSDLIKAAEAMGGTISWHGTIIEDVEGYATGIPLESRTAETEATARTVFESHPGKVGGGPFGQQNPAWVNGESYNAAARNLRAIMPTEQPMWNGVGGRGSGAGESPCPNPEPCPDHPRVVDGKSVPGAIATGRDAIWNPADGEEFERWAQQFGLDKIPGIASLVTMHTAFRNARSQGWHARNSGLSMAGHKIPPEGGTTNADDETASARLERLGKAYRDLVTSGTQPAFERWHFLITELLVEQDSA